MQRHRWLVLVLTACACAPSPGDAEEDASRDRPKRASSECAALVDHIDDAERRSAMFRELLAATPATDPERAAIRAHLAKAELAAHRPGPACAELAQAADEAEGDVADAIDHMLAVCCDDADPAAAQALAAAPRSDCGTDDEAACDERGVASCCARASIRYEYEMLEARKRGDETAARKHEARLLELWHRACEGGEAAACEALRQRE